MYGGSSVDVAEKLQAAFPRRGIPVTLLTGFLGAGKTTVLNHLLSAPHGLRVAVLINEFGKVDIDSQLVQQGDLASDNEVVLSNGCICCTISNSFVDAVRRVLDRKDNKPDYLLIETTGLADPAPIVVNLQETELNDELYLDQVLTVVDADGFNSEQFKSVDVATAQIRAADTILLSKVDLLESSDDFDSKIGNIRAVISQMRPNARVLLGRKGEIPVAALFDVGLSLRSPQTIPGKQHLHSGEEDENSCDCEPDEKKIGSHLDDDGFTSFSFVASRPLDLRTFRSHFLGALPKGVFRSKGLLWFKGYPVRFIFQLSGKRFEIEQDQWPTGEKPSTQLVIIGRDLPPDHELLAKLQSCLATGVDDRQLKIVAEDSS